MYSDDKVPAGKAEVSGCEEPLFLHRNLAPSQSAKFPPWLEQAGAPDVGPREIVSELYSAAWTACLTQPKLSPLSVTNCLTDLNE